MDYSDKEILDIVGYAVVFGAIWVIYRSPLLSWICKVIGLVLACFGVIIGVLFVVFSVYIPRGEYITAIMTILLFIGLQIPFTIFMLPGLKECFEKENMNLKLWE
jgi:hypothetical protein